MNKSRVVLAYKNFAANRNISHIGLGVAAINTSKVLNRDGIQCDVWAITGAKDLETGLELDAASRPDQRITHVVISAPWIPTNELRALCMRHPRIHFAINCHSNVGFLQADPNGIKLVREALNLEMSTHNFSTAANSGRMSAWLRDAYSHQCKTLPNLYFLSGEERHHHARPRWDGGVLRIGAFGAIRPQKNLASSVGAGIEIGHQLKAQTEIWISSGRSEGGGNTILNTIREMVKGLPSVKLVESGWQEWPTFRKLVGSMHVLLQPSYTESFNMVTADGIAEGVPSVVSDAITWVPKHWVSHADDVFDIARVGRALLSDHYAAHQGLVHLQEYVEHGTHDWIQYLDKTRQH